MLKDLTGSIAKAKITFDPRGDEELTMNVQYNPSSLHFQANAQAMPFKYLQNNVDASVPTQLKRSASIVMSVELVFDDTDRKDAFMADKFSVSPSDVVNDISAARRTLHSDYSVLPQTNAVIAAMLKFNTRKVRFEWNDMVFAGLLTEAQARYIMFSVSGHPIRSQVILNITQTIEDKHGAWDDHISDSFDDVFGKAGTLKNAAAASAASAIQNLFNFSK